MLNKKQFDNPVSTDPEKDNPESGPNKITDVMDPEFKIRLQLCAEGEPTGGEPTGGEPVNTEPGQSGVVGEPPQGGADIDSVVSELLKEHGLDNFKDIGGVAKSYKEQQAYHTRLTQEIANMREMLQAMQANNQPGKPELTPEQIEQMNDEFNNKFLDNPLGTLKEFVGNMFKEASGEIVKPLEEKLKPLAEKVETREKQDMRTMQAASFFNANPGATAYVEDIKQYIAANKAALDKLGEVEGINPFEFAYHAVKGMKMPDNPAELLNNENFVNAAMQNKDFVNKVLQAHMQSVKNGHPPTQIAGQGAGAQVTPPAAGEKPSSIADATKKYFAAKGWNTPQ